MYLRYAALILALFASCAAFAETKPSGFGSKPAFGGDFTFKKIKPPSSGAKNRINIQIEPAPDVPPETVAEAPTLPKPPEAADWFWDVVSSDIAPGGAGRFLEAVDALGIDPAQRGVQQPSLADLSRIVKEHGARILVETVGKPLSPAFVLAVIAVESSGNTQAVSSKGANGLMQLIPATAERFGVTDATDPSQNIRGGVTYLEWLLNEFDGDPILALAGYNAGENAVKKNGGVPPYPETRLYVPKVLAAWQVAKSLCLTAPQLHSDGCVFSTLGS